MGAFPTFLANHIPTPDEFQTLLPISAWKSSDTSRSSNTSPSNDPDLSVAVTSGYFYKVESVFFVTGAGSASAGDFLMQWTFPASSAMYWGGHGLVSAVAYGSTTSGNVETIPRFSTSSPSTQYSFGTPSTNFSEIIGAGFFLAGGSGNLTLQWSQRATSGTATTLGKYSHLIIRRIG